MTITALEWMVITMTGLVSITLIGIAILSNHKNLK